MSGSFVHDHRVKPQRDAAVSPLQRMPGRLLRGTDSMSPGTRDASAGEPLEPAFRTSMEARLAHDFSRVRVHTNQTAAQSAHQVGAQAFTVGGEIVLGAGAPSPGTRHGQLLLAHELAHVVQQHAGTDAAGRSEAGADAEREADAAAMAVGRGHAYAVRGRTGVAIARQRAPRPDAKTLDKELDEELQKHAARDPKSLDPSNPEYARTLQDYGYKLTHESLTLRSEPKNPKAKAEWKKRFAKSELLAGRILSKGGPAVAQKEVRGQLLASDLATAGFVDEAMALARQITERDIRASVYDSVMDRPDKVTPAQVAEITKFHVSRQVAMTDHPVLMKLQADDGAYARKLAPDKVNAALGELAKGYESEPGLPHELARILFFNPGIRAGFTKRMIEEKKGVLLKKVSEEPFFEEGVKIGTSAGGKVSPTEGTLAWAIANKQKVAVEDIMALTSAAKLPIKPPKAVDAKGLKAWLEANTETIGQAIKKQHPNDPDAAEAMLHQITSAFMYHVDPHAPDIKPDKGGKIAHLEAGGPQKSQLKVDCDVLATYSVRFLVSSGFTPVGYMGIVPTDKSRAAHAMAILRYRQEWRAVSNMESHAFPATTAKDEALKMLRDFGIQEAYEPSMPLTGFRIYYQDSDAKGTLPSAVRDSDASALIPTLGK
jgi:hypothetical protein